MLDQPTPALTAHTATVAAKLARLRKLHAAELHAIEELTRDEIWVGEGQSLFPDGQRGDAVCALLDGWACRCKDFRDGRRQIISLITPGDLVGVAEGVEARPTDHVVRALTRVKIAWIPRARLTAVLSQHSGLAAAVRAAAAVEDAILRAWLINLGQRSAVERMAFLFCELSERLSEKGTPADTFALPLTQQTLAHALGLTPVHVNRVLKRLRAERLIDFHEGMLTIHDPARARAMAGFDNAYLAA